MSEPLEPPQPLGIRAPEGSSWFEIQWSDTDTVRLPNSVLRGYCPCAGCQGHGGGIHFQHGRDSELGDITPVGNYALQLTWSDSHNSGIYSFQFLRKLCDLYRDYGDSLPTRYPKLP